MGIFEILLISVGLAMDSFAVSVCKGLSMKKMNWKKAVIIGLWFGIFQAGMPVIGFFLGSAFEKFITSIDHWIAFILLLFIGGKMIKEAFSKDSENNNDDTSFKSMLILAIATSIDALAIGIAYVCAYGSNNATLTFSSIGIITFFISVLGVKIGNKFGDKYENKAEFAGGLILVLLGIKILLEHLQLI
ncbi:MAG: manganese efflux pump [Clostridia bacterium]|nr:manganese efflux pump [Clostridia bacterium]